MAEDTKIESMISEQKSRRAAIKTAAQVAVTAPAVGLLLSASVKSAAAQAAYNQFPGDATACQDDCIDDSSNSDNDAFPIIG